MEDPNERAVDDDEEYGETIQQQPRSHSETLRADGADDADGPWNRDFVKTTAAKLVHRHEKKSARMLKAGVLSTV
jgi:hypothetical protein